MTLEGYFARFGEWTTVDNPKEGPRFRESVAKGAFSKTIAEGRGRIKLQLAHGQDPQVGDNPIGKLSELREDSHGGFYRADLFRLPELIEDGLRAQQFGASFRFSTVREDYTARPPRSDYNVERIPERVLREVRLFEISATSWPAYAGTSAVVRSEGDVIVMRATAGRKEVLPAGIASSSESPTIRRLRAARYVNRDADRLLRALDRGETVSITWSRDGFSSGRVLERSRKRTKDYLVPARRGREAWRL